MTLTFAKLARDEMAEAKRYYERQQRGLGRDFQRDTEVSAKRILENPLAWQIEYGPVRRFVFNRFPYKMLYLIREKLIVVVAVAHQHRNPDYWIDQRGEQ
ncbi:MAG: type II toxin-antitoxin system RelE/ParE family toxin [Sulfurimicrobium sp.]|nr:type II toxin-antitoxin system RelE/ParE family toxin [Sulfurimicrobium sp.]